MRCPLVLFYFALLATGKNNAGLLSQQAGVGFPYPFLNEGDPRQLIKRVKFKGTMGVSDLTADAVRISQGIPLLGPCEVTSPGTDFCMDPRFV